MNETSKQNITRSRWTLILLVVVFALPIALAWIISKNKSLQPATTKNYGELFQPARPLPEFKLKKIDGQEFSLEDMRRKWSFVYFVANHCDQVCQESLVKIRDARLAQSGEALRIHYFLIYTAQPDQTEFAQLGKDHPRLTLLVNEGGSANSLLTAFHVESDTALEQAHRVYLVDPIGNLMMHYPEGFFGNGLLKDIKYLLHVSQIG